MPPKYIILRQLSSQPCEVVLYDSDKQTREVLFRGRRWPARHFLSALRKQIALEAVPCYCEKKKRRGFPPRVIELVTNAI